VQGVGWDPRNVYFVTQSIDRTLRIYKRKKGPGRKTFYCMNVVKRRYDENIRVRPHPGPPKRKRAAPDAAASESAAEDQQPGAASATTELAPPSNVTSEHMAVEPASTQVSTSTSAPASGISEGLEPFNHKLFAEEINVNSFFRRLHWSPCGMFLFCPAGVFVASPDAHAVDCTYVFMRGDLVRYDYHYYVYDLSSY
jgi:hypothetical protein